VPAFLAKRGGRDRFKTRPPVTLAIDWDPDLVKDMYNLEKSKAFVAHESVQQCNELQNQPIELMDCLNFFMMEELLGQDALWYSSSYFSLSLWS
jgi:hypothetical protein